MGMTGQPAWTTIGASAAALRIIKAARPRIRIFKYLIEDLHCVCSLDPTDAAPQEPKGDGRSGRGRFLCQTHYESDPLKVYDGLMSVRMFLAI